jgi:hypothetical protein
MMEVLTLPTTEPKRHPATRAGSDVPYSLNARVGAPHYGVLVLISEQHGISLSAALRHVIERYAAGFTDAQGRTLLDVAADAAPGPEFVAWVQAQFEDEDAD